MSHTRSFPDRAGARSACLGSLGALRVLSTLTLKPEGHHSVCRPPVHPERRHSIRVPRRPSAEKPAAPGASQQSVQKQTHSCCPCVSRRSWPTWSRAWRRTGPRAASRRRTGKVSAARVPGPAQACSGPQPLSVSPLPRTSPRCFPPRTSILSRRFLPQSCPLVLAAGGGSSPGLFCPGLSILPPHISSPASPRSLARQLG